MNRQTGAIIWQLGGKRSSFTLQAADGQVLDNAGELYHWDGAAGCARLGLSALVRLAGWSGC